MRANNGEELTFTQIGTWNLVLSWSMNASVQTENLSLILIKNVYLL